MIESRYLSVAPMMAATHYWGRRFLRLFHPDIKIYGEMVPAKSLIFMQNSYKKQQKLQTGPEEGYVAFQLGASEVGEALSAAAMVVEAGFHEINLNCGCPSKAVMAGDFGAVLMKNPKKVATIIRALSDEFPHKEFSVKCRIGVDDIDDEEFLYRFMAEIISTAPAVRLFHIHARNAILKGLNPRQNRHIPPLNYQRVYAVKKKFPDRKIILNGGVASIADIKSHLPFCDGVMIGRAAIANPFLLAKAGGFVVDDDFYEKKLYPFLEEFDSAGVPTSAMLPFLMNMIRDNSGARTMRMELSQAVERAGRRREKLPLLTAWQAVKAHFSVASGVRIA
ncbi:MAG: tRNA dihydrouridine(20/20a) synthase DusA [Alphaproteobacteria bacterium]